MSRLEAPSTYRINTGGTIHVETDNPSLLALLQDTLGNTTGGLSTSSALPIQHTTTDRSLSQSHKPIEHVVASHGESVSLLTQTQQLSSSVVPGNKSAQPALSQVPSPSPATEDRPVVQTLCREQQLSAGSLRDTGSVSSHNCAVSVRSNAAKAGSNLVAVTQPRTSALPVDGNEGDDENGEEADDEGGDSEDGREEVDDKDTHQTGASSLRNKKTVDQVSVRGGESSPHAAPGVSPAVPDLPSTGRSSVTSYINPLLQPGSRPSSPGLNSPQHPRFVTPYASRRLKDHKPVSSNVSIALTDEHGKRTTLSVPRDSAWSVRQAARLRSGGDSTEYTASHSSAAPGRSGSEAHSESADRSNQQQSCGQPDPRADASETDSHRQRAAGPESGQTEKAQRPATEGEGDLPGGCTDLATAGGGSGEGRQGGAPSGPPLDRVYVEAPSFTQQEEEEYRFVSSHADSDDGDEDDHPTYRGLDQQALNSMESGTTLTRKPFKQVRYQDDHDRYEDREAILQPDPAPVASPQKQYVLKSKHSSTEAGGGKPPPSVKSLTLPSGPSYDPEDEEDLKREATYQQELKTRLETLQRSTEDTVVPRLPLLGEGEEGEEGDTSDFPQDVELDSQRQPRRDSMDVYEQQRLRRNMQNTEWGDPPSPPQRGTFPQQPFRQSYGNAPLQDAGYAGGRYAEAYDDDYYAGDDGEGMAGDGYGGAHPEQYATRPVMGDTHPNRPPQPIYAAPRDGYYMTEPRSYPQGSPHMYNQDYEGEEGAGQLHSVHNLGAQAVDGDRYQLEDAAQPHAAGDHAGYIGLPHRPDYDYVSHNKVDYGFSPKRTYRKILEVKRTEEEKLNHVFVHPKVKTRGKRGSRDNSPSRPLAIMGPQGDPMDQEAESLWAQRAAHLAHAQQSKIAGRRRPLVSSSADQVLHKLPSIQQPPQMSPAQSPSYPYTGEVQPGVSHHLVTEDGQRISVDVNFRLVSPPVGSEGEQYSQQPMIMQRQPGLQYPMVGGGNPGHYGSGGSHDYTDPVYTTTTTTNPYKKIPPIGASSEGAPGSAPEGGYMQSYLREREKQHSVDKPWYKVYNIRDYKRMQKEVQLGRGTLGPDLENDTYREKRDKLLRTMDYSKAVKDKNKEIISRKPATFPRAKEQDDMLSKRKLAVEYAKNVPKPSVKPKVNPYNNYEAASKLSPIAKPTRSKPQGQQESSVEVLDLQKLHNRHQQDKRSSEIIRQKAAVS